MLSRLRSRLTFANVTALLALFVALGGSSYAAIKVGSKQIVNNSIRSKDIRNNEVSGGDVKNRSLLSQDFKSGQLPAGPRGPQGLQGPRGGAGTPPAVEAPTLVTTFLNGWAAYEGDGIDDPTPVKYWKDLSGTVHLQGAVTGEATQGFYIFRLPPGYRPDAKWLHFPVLTTGATDIDAALGYVQILGPRGIQPQQTDGLVGLFAGKRGFVSLDGITFRAAP